MAVKHPLDEAELFKTDDLEFRTITTLLHALGVRENITLENFHVQPSQRSRLKLLSALSSLLVRDHEILAILPRRSVSGTTLFLSSEEEADISDNLLASPSNTFIARNPEFNHPASTVQLLVSPVVEVGNDVGEFILRNWDLSFESHVQAFANLLNTCLKAPRNDTASLALNVYSIFQSAPKICRRSTKSPLLKALPRIDTAVLEGPASVPEPSFIDRTAIEIVLLRNGNAADLHPALDKYLSSANLTRSGVPFELPAFHQFFLWFLGIVCEEIEAISKLRKRRRAPEDFPHARIIGAYKNLANMQYFAWESAFFASYIEKADPARFRTIWGDTTAEGLATGVPIHTGEPAEEGQEGIGLTEKQHHEEEVDRLDISTEYETGQDQRSSTATPPRVHPCILELRLITSNIQHLMTLLGQSSTASFDLQVIQYPRSGQRAKPWRDLVDELFPDENLRDRVVAALVDGTGWKFDIFRSSTPVFHGQAHCEAVLGCLYSLATRGEDISWTGVPEALLTAISTCYSVLAPSKRCCPVCAMIISLLSTEGLYNGGRHIHALSKHSVIFPCALPIGLPRSIREKLLPLYRDKLREQLRVFLSLQPIKSGRSGQSETFSQDGMEHEDRAARAQQELRQLYETGWEELGAEHRRAKWDRGRAALVPEQQMQWWRDMSDELRMGLTPPAPVLG